MLTGLVVRVAWLLAPGADADSPPRPVEGVYAVRRAVDGDTLQLACGVRVRLQGVDTPETVAPGRPVERWGPEAGRFTRRFLSESGGQVRLTFGAERIDRYGRWLAFVWSGDRMLNEELVREGLARARLDYRFAGRMKRRLADTQDAARRDRVGIWSDDSPTAPP